jgi:hypothetical protein
MGSGAVGHLVACGLRRWWAVELKVSDLQQPEVHWAIVNLIGNASHNRTIPVPDWVKDLIDKLPQFGEDLDLKDLQEGDAFGALLREARSAKKSFGTWLGSMQERPASRGEALSVHTGQRPRGSARLRYSPESRGIIHGSQYP